MAEAHAMNGDRGLDLDATRKVLLSNSTKHRIADLLTLRDALTEQRVPQAQYEEIFDLLLATYPLYIDTSSRHAAERTLGVLAASPGAESSLLPFVKELSQESRKGSLAAANAFTLVRWTSLIAQQSIASRALWDNVGNMALNALNHSLSTLLEASPKQGTTTTAMRVSRRAVRTIAKASFGPEALDEIITTFTAKTAAPAPRSALLLGIVAGVCRRLPGMDSVVRNRKQDFISFYLREFMGSRVALPSYLGNALNDFFEAFVSLEDFSTGIVPTVEKALLRAPEVVLNDLIAPVLNALPLQYDLSEVLFNSLLKPLLSSIKSSSAVVREGALRTFTAIAGRSRDPALVENIGDAILVPLKTNKVPSAEQRVAHATMLQALEPSISLSSKISTGLVAVASKEANEPAIVAELRALSKFLTFALQNDLVNDKTVLESYSKGMSDKRMPFRRAWAFSFADIAWSLKVEELAYENCAIFVDAVIAKAVDNIIEVSSNPLPAVQTGQVSIACAISAICLSKLDSMKHLKSAPAIASAGIAEKMLALEPKPSFALSPRVLTKLAGEEDLKWCQRAVVAVFGYLPSNTSSPKSLAWSLAVIYLGAVVAVPPPVRSDILASLADLYAAQPQHVSELMIKGLWQWCEDWELDAKDTAAIFAKESQADLNAVLRSIVLDDHALSLRSASIDTNVRQRQMRSLLILCRPQLISRASWIDLCLRTGTDPGRLVADDPEQSFAQVLNITQHNTWSSIPAFAEAAFSAAAELVFVAPEASNPLIVAQITSDLNPAQLSDIGPTEAAIYRTPEGTAFIDVLSTQSRSQTISKNSRDYDTLKWEEELRAQLAEKKGQTKKLTTEEIAKVNAQLAKESSIRKSVAGVASHLRRGIGIVSALANGPSTESEAWFGPVVEVLFDVIQAGAGLIVGDSASQGYLRCADRISSRLGPLRPFVGVATLRSAGITLLPENLLAEPLGDLVTRVLYRLRLLGEQRPFDAVTFGYILPLIFLILDHGGIDRPDSEMADEQILLAIEFLSFHTESCSSPRLPRVRLFACLLSAMQRFTQHFRPLKDCFNDLCRTVAPSMAVEETDCVVKGAIVADSSVRGAVLQAISAELELSDRSFYEEIWLACHDDVDEHVACAREIWEENELKVTPESAIACLPYLHSKNSQLRRAAARSVAASVSENSSNASVFESTLSRLQASYVELAQEKKPELDRFGMPIKKDLSDPWESRHGIALAFKELAPLFPTDQLVPFVTFLIESGPLADKHAGVREAMVEAATALLQEKGQLQVEQLMQLCENMLQSSTSASHTQDLVHEAVVIMYGSLAQHLPADDQRLPKVIDRLLTTLSTPSESVQYAVAQCLPPLVRASGGAQSYLQQVVNETLHASTYAARRGAAYGLAGIVKGRGIAIMRENRVLSTLRSATEDKKDSSMRQGAFLAYELLSTLLGRVFEPYVIQIVPQILIGFGDTSADVRDACLDAAKTCFSSLSSFGVKQVLPILLEGLGEHQWRSKKGASDSLGAMAYLDPQQLAISLPEIIPPLTEVLNDSHKEVRASANRSLQRFGEVISNPEVKSQVAILLKALSDPTKYTDDALDALIKVNFIHYLDAPSLALVVRILERGLGDRSATKRKAAQIIGSLAHLTERRDLTAHLPTLIAGLRVAIVDPVPTTRATASKALGSTIEKLGEDALPDLIPSLMQTLRSDTGAGDRLGSAQALSEVLAGLGTSRLEETLPSILQNVSSSKASVREGFMSLFIFLPACFGQSFANYLSKIIPPILAGLADEVESIRETALRAGRLLVKNFASRSVDLLLPELERGLADDSYRIRLSSVELVGDLLFNLTGISGKTEAEDQEENAAEAGQSLLDVLGEEKRNKILSALYICRCDTSGLVRTAAVAVWKALVSTPRTLRELIPTLTQSLIRRLASSNMEQKVIAGNALGELIRKAGEGVLATLLPTLEEGLQTTMDTDSRQGICIALREIINAASQEALEEYEKLLIAIVRTALVDSNDTVRESAAEAFDALQKLFGKRAIDQVLPHLLSLLRSPEDADNALAALLTLLTERTRSNAILPNLLPTLLTSPITAFNAKALASLARLASSSMTRRLPNILNALADNIVNAKDESVRAELNESFDTILLSVDEYDGLNTMMSAMLALMKHDDHRKRAAADLHMAQFFQASTVDYSRYYPDLIRALLIAFDDSDPEVVKAAWSALSTMTSKLRKEEMESLVSSTRQTLNHVGVAGSNLPGFSLPKGINAILPIFLQGLMNGSAEQRTQAALALSDIVDRTSPDGLKPFVTQIAGPLIRVVSERSTDLKCAIMLTLNNLLEKIPAFLKPFLPQLQRTFAKSLADPSSELLRSRAAKALGALITMTPRVDPLIAELATGSKTTDTGVRNAMLKALFEVVSKAGSNMSETSRATILGLIDSDAADSDDKTDVTYAKLLGAMIKVVPKEAGSGLIKSRILNGSLSRQSVLGLNAILVESPKSLTESYEDATVSVIVQGIGSNQPFIADNSILAAGKYLLTESSSKSFETVKPIIDALAKIIPPGNPVDSRRLALVVVRTVSREDNNLIRPHLATLVTPIFACVRDMVIPVKLAAEAAFLAIFSVVDEDSAVFDKYMAGPGASLQPAPKRSMQEYFKRIALRLSSQAKERRDAEGGQGGLGLSSDEREDEKEVWSIGKVDLGEGSFGDE